MEKETIAAIATAMTNAGISIVRISGEHAFDVIDRIYRSKSGKKQLSQQKTHTIHYGYIVSDEEIIDEVMVLLMRGPNSYTREDTVEIDCHGGVLVTQQVLEVVCKNGARVAEPGEFTKRAFLNGRIDLSQAESVIDVINAKNTFALQSSMHQLQGVVSEKIRSIREILIHEIAFIEAALDDPEHMSLDGYSEKLNQILIKLKKQMQHLLAQADNGRILKEGINTVIVGKPNAGKSSLLNLLVGHERAIVTEIAGTTRDVIEEQIHLHGISLNIMDTAGIRETSDVIEQIGVTKTMEYMSNADLIIHVIDASKPLTEEDKTILVQNRNKKAIILLNKNDLNTVIEKQEIQSLTEQKVLSLSAKKGNGLELLEESIKEMFFHGEVKVNDEVYLTNVRHKTAMQEALESIQMVEQSILSGMPEDFYSIDLMNAYTALGKIIGESVEEDFVNEIFQKFCMGK